MRKVAIGSLMTIALAITNANAGSVTFTPQTSAVEAGTPAVFDVSVSSSSLATFDSVGLLIGSDTTGLAMAFALAPAFVASTTVAPSPPAPFFVFGTDVFAGGNRFVAPTDQTAWRAPLLIGTLTVQTTGMAQDSFFDVFVDGGRESDLFGSPLSQISSAGGTAEGLSGRGTVSIVPEPATLSLLGLGVVALIRRRFAA